VVVAEDRRVEVCRLGEVPAVRAQVVSGGEGGVEDVVRVGDAVTVAVRAPGRPGGGDELHGAFGAGPAAAGGGNSGVAAGAVEEGTEDRGSGGPVRGDVAAIGLPGLDLADGGQHGPGQVAPGSLTAIERWASR
jgi:hypothetical protein